MATTPRKGVNELGEALERLVLGEVIAEPRGRNDGDARQSRLRRMNV